MKTPADTRSIHTLRLAALTQGIIADPHIFLPALRVEIERTGLDKFPERLVRMTKEEFSEFYFNILPESKPVRVAVREVLKGAKNNAQENVNAGSPRPQGAPPILHWHDKLIEALKTRDVYAVALAAYFVGEHEGYLKANFVSSLPKHYAATLTAAMKSARWIPILAAADRIHAKDPSISASKLFYTAVDELGLKAADFGEKQFFVHWKRHLKKGRVR